MKNCMEVKQNKMWWLVLGPFRSTALFLYLKKYECVILRLNWDHIGRGPRRRSEWGGAILRSRRLEVFGHVHIFDITCVIVSNVEMTIYMFIKVAMFVCVQVYSRTPEFCLLEWWPNDFWLRVSHGQETRRTHQRLESTWPPCCCLLQPRFHSSRYGSVHLHNFALRNIRGEGQHLAKFRIPMIHRFMTSHPRCKVAALLWREAARCTPDTFWLFQYFHPQANGILYLEYWGCFSSKYHGQTKRWISCSYKKYHGESFAFSKRVI